MASGVGISSTADTFIAAILCGKNGTNDPRGDGPVKNDYQLGLKDVSYVRW
ncbi:hypothetical protein FRUB_06258 [Fimbriiglobus ruber]|uniref:Uncharacterized protein n=1 Tax=Fimbriiglobus ruber TaxID=1908690 RepID=A0A225DNW8_9BACT|nr:hypothetical protein FRUB_06258 [Fimbriiglobus ruber]